MPRGNKFTADKIIGKLREAEVELARGRAVPEDERELGVTEKSCYGWKREYGGPPTYRKRQLLDAPPSIPTLERLRNFRAHHT